MVGFFGEKELNTFICINEINVFSDLEANHMIV